jgi:hypothetical protein
MLIESKIKREGGSRITFGGAVYHFAPDASGAHVCEVADEAAIARLLSIPEAYRLVGNKPPAAAAKPAADKPEGDEPGDEEPETGMVLKNGDQSVNLMEMGKKPLMAFAKEAGFKVDAMASAQAIRESIYKQAKG